MTLNDLVLGSCGYFSKASKAVVIVLIGMPEGYLKLLMKTPLSLVVVSKIADSMGKTAIESRCRLLEWKRCES